MIPRWIAALYHKLPLVRELGYVEQRLARLQDALVQLRSIEALRFIEWQRRNDPRYADTKRLLRHAFQVCSQSGEDGIIHEIFRRIGGASRTFFESGVGDGVENNTSFLLSTGWSGFWVDANPRFIPVADRANATGGRLRYAVAKLAMENVVEVMTSLAVPPEFDLLSLDIDQNTYFVWKAIGSRFSPRVVAIEYNGMIPPDVEWVVQYDGQRVWDGTHNFGGSLKAYEKLGAVMGYSLVGCEPLGANAFFVRNDLVGEHFAAPFTAENHFEPPRFSLIHRSGLPNQLLDRNGINKDPV